MSVLLWNWKHDFGKEMEGRVLIFSRFALREHKGNESLSNGMRSAIIMNHGHSMNQYEGKHVDISSFEAITQPWVNG
jgi:hypothetical protein